MVISPRKSSYYNKYQKYTETLYLEDADIQHIDHIVRDVKRWSKESVAIDSAIMPPELLTAYTKNLLYYWELSKKYFVQQPYVFEKIKDVLDIIRFKTLSEPIEDEDEYYKIRMEVLKLIQSYLKRRG